MTHYSPTGIGMELPATPVVQGSVISPPKGWSTEGVLDFEDAGDGESDAQMVGERYGLRSPRGIMWMIEDDYLLMFQSDNRFYIWNPIEDGVWEIQKVTGLGEIIAAMTKMGLGSLPLQKVPRKRS